MSPVKAYRYKLRLRKTEESDELIPHLLKVYMNRGDDRLYSEVLTWHIKFLLAVSI